MLSNFPYYLISDDKIKKLSSNQKKIIDNFISLVESKKYGHLVYRGENIVTLINDFIDSNIKEYGHFKDYEIKHFNNLIFLIGPKSKHYHKNQNKKITNRKYLKSINDTSDETFRFIFNKIKSIKKIDKATLHQNVKNHINTEKAFFKYFQKNEPDSFIEIINKLEEKEKIKIRDYYLFFLHTLGNKGTSDISFLISTSLKYSIADNYSDGIIIHAWTPKPISKFSVSKKNFHLLKKAIDNVKLPTFHTLIYPREQEVSIKGGIYPHYIIGYENLKSKQFIVNNHIFDINANFIENFPEMLIKFGFIIDQAEFKEKIKNTKYSKYTTEENGFFNEENVT